MSSGFDAAADGAEIHARRLMTLTGLIELVFKEPLDAKKQEQTVLSMVIAMAAEKQKLRAGNRWSGTLSTPSSPRHRRSSRHCSSRTPRNTCRR